MKVRRGILRQVADPVTGKPSVGLFSFYEGHGPAATAVDGDNPRAVVILDADVFDEDQAAWDEIERALETAKARLAELEPDRWACDMEDPKP